MAERKTSTRRISTRKTSTRKTSTRKTRVPRKASARKSPAKKSAAARKRAPRKWSAHVTETSDALDLKDGVFKGRDPHKIALSLKHSAEQSRRKKGSAYQSAMSMLNFYINRAGHNLPASRLKTLNAAKGELRAVFGKEAED
ncbi:MAG: DUF3175 domain-containing protein [Methylobacteriaceae bacterium]|nr:DUF3175 domain-containing protein [Methylobacteriaceae bacterium]